MKRCALMIGAALMFPAGLFAAQSPAGGVAEPPSIPPACRELVDAVRNATDQRARELAAADLAKMHLHTPCFAEILLASAKERQLFASALQQLEFRRTDKQAGGTTGAGTSLVAKGTTAKVLSVAAEYGALTESVSKQVVTVAGSLDGPAAAAVRNHLVAYCPTHTATPGCLHADTFDWLRRISYSVSFDMSPGAQTATGTPQGAAQPTVFDPDGHSLTAATGRFVLWNSRDAVSKAFQQAWVKAVRKTSETSAAAGAAAQASPFRSASGEMLLAMQQLLRGIDANPDYDAWFMQTTALLANPRPADEFYSVWLEQQRLLAGVVTKADPNAAAAADRLARAVNLYRFEEDELVRETATKAVLTLQYDYRHPASHPPTSIVRVVFDKGFNERWSIAANGAVELYARQPSADIPGAARLRDAQFGVQIQYDLGKLDLLGAAAVSGAFYYQYQNSPSILDVTPATPLAGITFIALPSGARQVFAEKGNVGVAQVRLVLGPSQSSARIPLSITYSNRTELIAKPLLRAQIGVSYDFDSLFAK